MLKAIQTAGIYRKLYSLLVLMGMALGCAAQSGIHFHETDLNDALRLSQSEKKPVLFMGYASWCGHCKNMKEQVLTDSAVANFYNSLFICLEMDMEKDEGIVLKEKFGVTSYPTFVFLDSTGVRLYQVMGELKASDFIEQGKNALTTEKQLPYLQRQFESNPTDSDKCYKYLLALRHGGLDAQLLMDSYFKAYNGNPMLTPLNWKILNMGISDIETSQFQFLVNHQAEYGTIVSKAKVERKIFRTAAYSLQPLADANDSIRYFSKRKIAAGIHLFSIDSLLFNLDLMVFENNNKWIAYREEAISHTREYDWNDYSQLDHIANAFLKNCTDKPALTEAANWAKKSVEIKEEYGNTLLYAQLLNKTNDESGAIQAAEKAKTLAKKTGAGSSEADELLSRLYLKTTGY